MCTFAIITDGAPDSLALYIFDHNCHVIGYNPAGPVDALASPGGFGIASELPDYVVAHVGNLVNNPMDVSFWYNGVQTIPSDDIINIKAEYTMISTAQDTFGIDYVWVRAAFRC